MEKREEGGMGRTGGKECKRGDLRVEIMSSSSDDRKQLHLLIFTS